MSNPRHKGHGATITSVVRSVKGGRGGQNTHFDNTTYVTNVGLVTGPKPDKSPGSHDLGVLCDSLILVLQPTLLALIKRRY